MRTVRAIYEQLHKDYRITGYEYSRQWLKKSRGYYAYLKSTDSEANKEVLLALYGEAIRRRKLWEQSTKEGNGRHRTLYARHLAYFKTLEADIAQIIRQEALTI